MRRIKVKVISNASKNEVVETQGCFLKVKLAARPEKGKANKALIAFLAQHFDVPKSSVLIEKGEKVREKVIILLT